MNTMTSAHNSSQTSSHDVPQGYMVPTKQIRLSDLQARKGPDSTPFAMVTAYDYSTAVAFAEAGIEMILVGDSAANVVFGYTATQQVSMDEMCYLAAAVVRGAGNAFVVVDLPFGTYEASDEQAVASAAEIMRRSGGHCVKIEGGERIAPRIKALKNAGIPVCAHIGFTPQSVNALGGFKVQGRGAGAEQLKADMRAVAEAGADFVVMEMVPAAIAQEITEECPVPTIGIGAGPHCDGQVLVWHDMVAFPAGGHRPKFAKQWGSVGATMTQAAADYKREVAEGTFPAEEHCF
ncbi:3-methyl-2-oxobutanoate hydroxymethyltransferase [Corynebacterium sp. 320]|uniref:3-methyl-2-oxobutanoate hydroxymethyltransferase n=1 Tax=Corynebacterium TaxID=1716 RepID=UPI00125CAF7F|nr:MULTISPECIES: 3-methyl-2-oxobutanoate hydroxymethyltransferase [Corynebacterium]KAB1502444.1 3-methyl-2-oxobutanoate hydroxymethyltransferase [Corynebacterium sp. 320]KAB1551335.1 3-methyl-2-oxobutanoate hydroxymethyltransferase [Corynebacterium sp. 321]KAB1551836.1 3-methyl-2-oxobutanoate hydroxymethyltransferase [Corynebacterium sp. 319]KAB3526051.1 3-methyl-2-oxobutanoate hydroxymethyltransferase [Corynebacterium sp. 250]KAB3538831.1 3-methyl-2-oxobutanoate hydroxymethyltransferase [Cory